MFIYAPTRKQTRFLIIVGAVALFMTQGCSAKPITSSSNNSLCRTYHFSNGKELHVNKTKVIRLFMVTEFPKQRLSGLFIRVPDKVSNEVREILVYPASSDIKNMQCHNIANDELQRCRFIVEGRFVEASIIINKNVSDSSILKQYIAGYLDGEALACD